MEASQQIRKERLQAWIERGVEIKDANNSQKYFINHQGIKRSYLVYLPKSYNENTPTPVVLNFHGGGGSAQGHQKLSRMNKKAERAGFIVVYPVGTRRDGNLNKMFNHLWNVENGPNGPYYAYSDPISRIDDVGFVDKLLDDLESRFNIDTKRVYASGLSNGEILTHLLACRLYPRIAAIAPVGAPYWNVPDECPIGGQPLPVILFHGTSDICAPYYGGISQCSSNEAIDRHFISAQETADIWVEKNSCANTPIVTYQKGEVSCRTYPSCSNGSEVTLCTIEGGGHTWRGGMPYAIPGLDIGKTTYDINANDAMWEFFKNIPIN
jgi:polyhydroxybutyrate depolymerase